jgi:DNA-binding protein HU-beta
MNKTELVSAISTKGELSKKDAEIALNAFMEVVKETLLNDEKIQLVGFGTFDTADVKEKTGTIQLGDRKGELYTTPAHVKPTFKFSKSVKDQFIK